MRIRREKVYFVIVFFFFIALLVNYIDGAKPAASDFEPLSEEPKQTSIEPLPDIDLDDPYPDAPNPDNDPKQWTKNRALWPDLRIQVDKKAVEAKVKEEWESFAAKFPDNVYLPNEFKKQKTPAQLKQWRETLDIIADVEIEFANMRAQLKKVQPGEQPPDLAPAEIDVEKQQVYLAYQLEEVTSRIQLLQFYLDSGNTDEDQTLETEQEIERLGEEKNTLTQALNTGNAEFNNQSSL